MEYLDKNIEYEEHEIFSNFNYANYVKKVFLIFIGLLTVDIVLEVMAYLRIFSYYELKNVILLVTFICFCSSTVLYLIWYYKVNKNYWVLSGQVGEVDYLRSSFFWFIPGLNILVPYFRLKIIKSTYAKNQNKGHQSIFENCLKIWAISFLCFYYTEFYIVADLPLLPDDINFYYLKYPYRKLFDLIIIKQLAILGLFAMYVTVDDIQALETNIMSDNKGPILLNTYG